MLTEEQVEMLNGMCLGAHEVELGSLLLELQKMLEAEDTIVWHNFNEDSTK